MCPIMCCSLYLIKQHQARRWGHSGVPRWCGVGWAQGRADQGGPGQVWGFTFWQAPAADSDGPGLILRVGEAQQRVSGLRSLGGQRSASVQAVSPSQGPSGPSHLIWPDVGSHGCPGADWLRRRQLGSTQHPASLPDTSTAGRVLVRQWDKAQSFSRPEPCDRAPHQCSRV